MTARCDCYRGGKEVFLVGIVIIIQKLPKMGTSKLHIENMSTKTTFVEGKKKRVDKTGRL